MHRTLLFELVHFVKSIEAHLVCLTCLVTIVLFRKAFCLEPECERDINFGAQYPVNNIVEEQL